MLFEADYAKNYASIMYQCLRLVQVRQNLKKRRFRSVAIAFLYFFLFHSLLRLTSFLSEPKKKSPTFVRLLTYRSAWPGTRSWNFLGFAWIRHMRCWNGAMLHAATPSVASSQALPALKVAMDEECSGSERA